MRGALAMFFAALLGITQAGLTFSAPASPTAACKHCICPGQSCCSDRGSRSTSSAPLAPVRQVSPEQVQLLAQHLAAFAFFPPSEPVVPHCAASAIFSSTAVPLYYRNCSLLI